jgi:hypothetical protein
MLEANLPRFSSGFKVFRLRRVGGGGWPGGPPELGAHLSKMALINLYGLPGFVMEAAGAALRNGDLEV